MRAYTSFAPWAANMRCNSSGFFAVILPSVKANPPANRTSANGLSESEMRKSRDGICVCEYPALTTKTAAQTREAITAARRIAGEYRFCGQPDNLRDNFMLQCINDPAPKFDAAPGSALIEDFGTEEVHAMPSVDAF